MGWIRACVAILAGYLASLFVGCAADEPEPGSICSKEGARECGDGGTQFCGIQCSQGGGGLGGHCNDSPTWSRCVEDPVCVPGDESDCGFGEESECADWTAQCILELENDGVPTFDIAGDCFC